MAIGTPVSRGVINEKSVDGSLAISPSAEIAVGRLAILVAATNNDAVATGSTTKHSVADTDGHTWTKLFEETHSAAAAANDGVTFSAWATRVTSAIGTGDSVTLTLNGYTTAAKAMGLVDVPIDAAFAVEDLELVLTTAGGDTDVTLAGLTSQPYLLLGCRGWESNNIATVSGDADYTFLNSDASSGGGATTNIGFAVDYRLATLTGDTWTASALAGVTERVFVLVAIYEDSGGAPQDLTGTLFTKAPTFNAGTLTANYALTGTLFVRAPTFPQGDLSLGAQDLAGVLFTKAPTFFPGSFERTTYPFRQQISEFLTGTSISGVLRVAPVENNIVFAVFSAATTLANLTGPSGYTKAAEEEGDGVSIQLWYKRAGAAESATVTATSSASVALKIHVFESPGDMFAAGDPLDEVATNDSSTSAVTTLATGTTAAVGQANTFAIAAVTALGGNEDLLLVNWSNDYTALSDHETRGLMVGYKVMTSAAAATATATWNQATSPTSHKAAGLVATFAMAAPITLPEPSPRRVSFGRIGASLNTTGTVDTVATFPVVADTLYLAFVATSKDLANNGDAVIPDSHGVALDWVLVESHSIGTSRRMHVFRALSASGLSAASISITTPESACNVWWEVVEVSGAFVSSGSAGAIAQTAVDDEPTGATFVEASFGSAPSATNAVLGFALHGSSERQLVDLTPQVHTLLGEANVYDSGGQRATVDWFQGVDQTFRWDWATSIHALAILVEVQGDVAIGGAGYPQTAAPTETTFATSTTAHLVLMPPTVNAGDLLVILAAFDGAPTITNPGGWTELENSSSAQRASLITAKVADGTEDGTTVDVVTSVAEAGAAQVYRITNWWGTIATGVAITSRNEAGAVASNDVPDLNPNSWDVEFTLWIAALNAGTATGNQDVTTYPTDYLNGIETDPSGGGAAALVASARRESAVAAEAPDSFVLSAAPQGSATRLLAIRPAAGSGYLVGNLFTKAPSFFVGDIAHGAAGAQDLIGTLFAKAPTFNVGALAATYNLAGALFTKAPTFSQGAITAGAFDLAGVLFQKAPTFFQGTITAGAVDLSGELFTKAPTFFSGAISVGAVDLAGVLFQTAPVFNAGTMSQEGGPQVLGGDLFTKSPTFPQGTVSAGAVGLTGVLFQKSPTFNQGAVASSFTLVGVLFQKAPTFPQGELIQEQILVGVLFENTPQFFEGAMGTGALDGVLFVSTPTFFVGVLTQGERVFPTWPASSGNGWETGEGVDWPVSTNPEWEVV